MNTKTLSATVFHAAVCSINHHCPIQICSTSLDKQRGRVSVPLTCFSVTLRR